MSKAYSTSLCAFSSKTSISSIDIASKSSSNLDLPETVLKPLESLEAVSAPECDLTPDFFFCYFDCISIFIINGLPIVGASLLIKPVVERGLGNDVCDPLPAWDKSTDESLPCFLSSTVFNCPFTIAFYDEMLEFAGKWEEEAFGSSFFRFCGECLEKSVIIEGSLCFFSVVGLPKLISLA